MSSGDHPVRASCSNVEGEEGATYAPSCDHRDVPCVGPYVSHPLSYLGVCERWIRKLLPLDLVGDRHASFPLCWN
jgi:hypothetical protein